MTPGCPTASFGPRGRSTNLSSATRTRPVCPRLPRWPKPSRDGAASDRRRGNTRAVRAPLRDDRPARRRAGVMTLTILTPGLEIAYEAHGDPRGFPVVLLHGFPDDVRAWDGVAPALAAAGCRVLVPYLRGYGPTRFLDPAAPRMAQQAAIGQDLLDFVDALALPRVALARYDWGGRAACIAAIVAPARVRALVTIGGEHVRNTTAAPRAPVAGPGGGR